MRVTELVREVKLGVEQAYSPREVHLAIRSLAGPTRVVTVSGGSAEARADLLGSMTSEMRWNPEWSLVSLAQLHERATGRAAAETGSFKGFVVTLFEAARGDRALGRLGYGDPETFATALGASAQKIHAALTGLALNGRGKMVVMLDVGRWPSGLAAELGRVASHASHGTFKIVMSGASADKLIPPNAPSQNVASITLP